MRVVVTHRRTTSVERWQVECRARSGDLWQMQLQIHKHFMRQVRLPLSSCCGMVSGCWCSRDDLDRHRTSQTWRLWPDCWWSTGQSMWIWNVSHGHEFVRIMVRSTTVIECISGRITAQSAAGNGHLAASAVSRVSCVPWSQWLCGRESAVNGVFAAQPLRPHFTLRRRPRRTGRWSPGLEA